MTIATQQRQVNQWIARLMREFEDIERASREDAHDNAQALAAIRG
jgi:hypothetical protein